MFMKNYCINYIRNKYKIIIGQKNSYFNYNIQNNTTYNIEYDT